MIAMHDNRGDLNRVGLFVCIKVATVLIEGKLEGNRFSSPDDIGDMISNDNPSINISLFMIFLL